MKNKLVIAMLALALTGGTVIPAFAQDAPMTTTQGDSKSKKKARKATKKADKGKETKALKKDKKSDDKAEMGK